MFFSLPPDGKKSIPYGKSIFQALESIFQSLENKFHGLENEFQSLESKKYKGVGNFSCGSKLFSVRRQLLLCKSGFCRNVYIPYNI